MAVPAPHRARRGCRRSSCSRGPATPVALAQEWAHGAGYGDSSGRAAPAAVLAEHGWDRDLPSFRPFLSYAELATMFDTLSSLYDALTPVLGLADVDELAKRLGEARLAYDNQRKAVASSKDALVARLDPDDERAALVAGVLGARKPDLDALAELLRDAPEYGEDTAQLRRLAGLARAVRRRDPGGVRSAARGRARARRRGGDGRASARPTSPRCCAARSRSATARTARCAARRACSTTRGRSSAAEQAAALESRRRR